MKLRVILASALLLAMPLGWAADVIAPWSRATPPGAKVAGVFMQLKAGSEADVLLSAQTPQAARVELHEMAMVDGVMKMRQVSQIVLPAGKSVELKPGGLHVMLFELKAPLQKGQIFPLTLTFSRSGKQTIQVQIEEMGAARPAGGHQHH